MALVDWGAFAPTAVGISAVPGANQMLSLRNAYRSGVGPAMAAVAGRLVAFLLMIVLVALGLGAVLARSTTTFSTVKWTGVAYLLLLGLHALWSARRASGPDGTVDDGSAHRGTLQMLREEFLVAATNPKAIVLFAALLPQFVSAPGSVSEALLAVGVAYLAVEAAVGFAYCVVGSRLRRSGITATRDLLLQRISGTTLIAFAVYLGVTAKSA